MSTTSQTKPATKTVAKPAVKLAVKPAPKAVFKTSATPAANLATKTTTNLAVKPAVKPATKATAPAAKKAAPAKKAVVKTEKPKKIKLVRDSFTVPKNELVVLDDLKLRALSLKTAVKKGELLRAGIKALAAMNDTAFLAAMKAVPALKTGRPKK